MQLMLMLKKVNSGLLESSNRIEIILSVGLVPKLLECFNYTATYCHLICLNFIARSFWHCWRRNQSLDEKVNALIWLVLSVVQALSLLNWLVTLNCYRRRSKLDWWSTAIPVVPFLAVPFSPGCLVFTSTLLSRPSAVLGWATSLQLAGSAAQTAELAIFWISHKFPAEVDCNTIFHFPRTIQPGQYIWNSTIYRERPFALMN